jgi:uncharacterized protein YigE (DUF2233 family)
MKRSILIIVPGILFIATVASFVFALKERGLDARFISYVVHPGKQDIKLYWKNDKGKTYRSIGNLKSVLAQKGEELLFAMNGGMYRQDNSPVGLFIENGKMLAPLDTTRGEGNFYLQPNGVFFITTANNAVVCSTPQFRDALQVKHATQSGPMLVIEGNIHPAFSERSSNTNIRNGVGILPGNRVIFAMSKKAVTLYEFAAYFRSQGCRNALYLDGLVSRTFLPQKNWIQTDGDFGVIIGVTTPLRK